MRHGNLFVISAPSGGGKGTLIKRLLAEVPDAWLSVSATTRAPRDGETDGIDYYFIDRQTFDRMVDADNFLEWAEYAGNRYGTPRSSVQKRMEDGKQVLLEIDVQGAFQVRERVPGACMIFIEPPSMEILEQRLRSRGTEGEDEIIKRMRAAEVELSKKGEYDTCIVNGDLDQAVRELVDYVNKRAEDYRGLTRYEHH